MEIRRYNPGEESAVWKVYFAATHESNARDYHPDLIDRWAPQNHNVSQWADRLAQKNPFVAVVDKEIVGMAEIEPGGFIDYFYVHPRWQNRGIGKAFAICSVLLVACTSGRQSARQGSLQAAAIAADELEHPGQEPLYLHFLSPRVYGQQELPARKIATARVHLGRRFAQGAPEPALCGRIDRQAGKYVAEELSGTIGGTKNLFWGEMSPEQPLRAKGVLAGSITFQGIFVLSTNSDCSAFLKVIDPPGLE